jgi:hypothetical protein
LNNNMPVSLPSWVSPRLTPTPLRTSLISNM